MTPGRTAMAGTLVRCYASAVYRCIRAATLLGALAFSSPLLADSLGDGRIAKRGTRVEQRDEGVAGKGGHQKAGGTIAGVGNSHEHQNEDGQQ